MAETANTLCWRAGDGVVHILGWFQDSVWATACADHLSVVRALETKRKARSGARTTRPMPADVSLSECFMGRPSCITCIANESMEES